MGGQIKSWSFSRLSEFEQCAYRTKLKIIDKIPEPERPLKPGQTEHANDRGTRIHEAIENFIRGKGAFPPEAIKFKDEINSLANRFAKGSVSLEGEWGFDANWAPCQYNKAWCKVKCDAVIHLSKKHIVVVDYKTGRKFGNEIKHGEQVQLYALAASILFPDVETIDVELWYLDQDDLTHESKPAARWMKALKLFTNRGNKMLNETEFKPNPNVYSCKYCPYKEEVCTYAYKDKQGEQNFYKAKAVRRKGEKV
jgi:RecB family exonuclease